MTTVRVAVTVAPATVTRKSAEFLETKPRRSRSPQAVASVRLTQVDQQIMAYLHRHRVDFHRVEVLTPTEVVIHNRHIR